MVITCYAFIACNFFNCKMISNFKWETLRQAYHVTPDWMPMCTPMSKDNCRPHLSDEFAVNLRCKQNATAYFFSIERTPLQCTQARPVSDASRVSQYCSAEDTKVVLHASTGRSNASKKNLGSLGSSCLLFICVHEQLLEESMSNKKKMYVMSIKA